MKNNILKQILLFLVSIALVNCTNDENEQQSKKSNYSLSINGQSYQNSNLELATAAFTEGVDINSGNSFYSVVATLEDNNIQITGAPLVIEGITMPINENTNDSSGLVITTTTNNYVAISGTMLIKSDKRYNEIDLGNGATTGKNEILIEFSSLFRDNEANEITISGRFYVAK